MSFVEVLSERDLWIGELRRVMVADRRVLLLRTERGVHAYADRRPQLGAPLSRSALEAEQLDAIGVECRDGKILIDIDRLAGVR
jgi:nitrite reductase/ring-hydroxylating ferredoxin subunit